MQSQGMAAPSFTRHLTNLLVIVGFAAILLPGCAPTAAPARADFARWRAEVILNAFQHAGLGITEWRYANKDADDGFAMTMVVETKRFRLARENIGGTILAFQNERDQLWMYEYYVRLGETNPAYASWLWTRGNVIVQIDRALAPERAREFQRVLNQMK
jgi:hypothetical protein